MKHRLFLIFGMLISIFCCPVLTNAQKVIYEAMSSPHIDLGEGNEAMEMIYALGATGMTIITDLGNGSYKISISMGGKQTVTDNLKSPKIINDKKIQFTLASNSNTVITLTPDNLDLAGKMDFIIIQGDEAFADLLKTLKAKPGTSSPNTSTGKTSAGSKSNLPTSGTLNPVNFISHPFGFLDSYLPNIDEAARQLRQKGWKAEVNNSGSLPMIMIISSTPFKIPFKLYGKDVSIMTAVSKKGSKVYGWDLEVSDFKSNWNSKDAEDFANKLTQEIKNLGFLETDDKYLYGKQFYRCVLEKDGKTVTVSATENSKYEPWDAYGVSLEVRDY